MTTIPQPLLADLHRTADPLQRAALLNEAADAHELTGTPNRARLLRLVAATETLIARPDTSPEDDPAWDDGLWWQLAGTTNRLSRADLLEEIWRDWAPADFGDDADILLQIAVTEREAAQLQDDDLDADPFVTDEDAAGETDPDGQEAPAEEMPPSTVLRDFLASGAMRFGVGLFLVSPVALVAIPQVSWQVKAISGGVLFVSLFVWLIRQMRRPPMVSRGPQR